MMKLALESLGRALIITGLTFGASLALDLPWVEGSTIHHAEEAR